MAQFPSKRRKLSPDVATPGDVPTQIWSPSDGTRITPSRPSFAAPTRASLARHNPQLLNRALSVGAVEAKQRGSDSIRRATRAGSAPETPSKAETPVTGVAGPVKTKVPSVQSREDRQAEIDAPPTRPLSPHAQSTRPSGDGSASRPPEDFFPKAAQSLEGPIDAGNADATESNGAVDTAPHTLEPIEFPKPPVALRVAELVDSHESDKDVQPDLPPTPVQRGLKDPIVTTPPSGIHNTPSKKSKRIRGAKTKPSPLRPPPEPHADDAERRPKRQRTLGYPARHLVPVDPYAEKRKIREELLKEVEQLKKDIAIAERENERQRMDQNNKRFTEPSNSDELVSLLQRWTAESSTKPASPKPASIFHSIASFLPFARRPRPKVATPPEEVVSISHLPIPQNDQLPYLQLFTPLTYTSTITLLPPDLSASDATPSPNEVFQNHVITAKAPSGLFSARLGMTVNASSFSISHLEIQGLDSCAEAEFGRWARTRARGRGFLGRDINAICIAMSRWYETALRRARFWCTLESELGTEDGRRQSRERLKIRRKGKNRSAGDEADEQKGEEGDNALESENGKETVWTRRQLLPQMRRSSLVLSNDNVELLIEWSITIDWVGEAESCISASVQIPSSWQDKDERGSMAKVPETFDRLVRAQGPLAAVRSLVALLMPL